MPGLLRGVARTAVVAGTATAVSNRVSRRQANRWSQQESQQAYGQQGYASGGYGPPARYEDDPYEQQAAQAAPAPPPADSTSDKLDQLARLGELKSQGVLTEAEFEEQKRRILA
jgi:hypothetical protein